MARIQNSLNVKYHILMKKTNSVKSKIKQIERQIKKEEDKLNLREKDRKRILIYFNDKKENNNKDNNNNNKDNNKIAINNK